MHTEIFDRGILFIGFSMTGRFRGLNLLDFYIGAQWGMQLSLKKIPFTLDRVNLKW